MLSIALLMLFAITSFCQKRSAEEYMAKSRHLRTGGIILLTGGAGLAVAGTVLILGDKSNLEYNSSNTLSSRTTTGLILIAAGTASSLGSIPLFVASRAMHKKASRIMRASTYLNIEQVPDLNMMGMHLQPFPAAGIKLDF